MKIQNQILDKKNYKNLEGIGSLTYIKVKNGNQEIIVSHSPKRARKDAHERAKALETLQKKLEKSNSPKTLLPKRGYNKYLKIKTEGDRCIGKTTLGCTFIGIIIYHSIIFRKTVKIIYQAYFSIL